jgi:hypothetical protein
MARILCPSVVGRRDEIAQLGQALDEAQRGHGRMLVVSGQAGIGKSRLLAEAAAEADRRAATVLAGSCVPSAVAVPYRPLGEALIAAPRSVIERRSGELAGFEAALGWIVPAWRGSGPVASLESPIVRCRGSASSVAGSGWVDHLLAARQGHPAG